MAMIGGDDVSALRIMAPAVEQIDRMGGGSREQKDIFTDVVMELHRRVGNAEPLVGLAQRRLLANPYHLQSLAALAWAYARLGDATLARQACRQLVARADESGAAPEAPELRAARRVLEAA